MKIHPLLWLSVLSVVVVGCRSGGGIRETTNEAGIPVRIEVAEAAEAGEDTGPVVAERMRVYRRRSAGARRGAGAGATTARRATPGAPETATGTEATAETAHDMAAETADVEFDPFIARDCPPEGSAQTVKYQTLNRLKNRVLAPTAGDIDPQVTLEALREDGDDRDRWWTGLAATIEGYVHSVKATGAETCNCGASAQADTDTHIDITAGPEDAVLPVVVEVTPVWRLMHEHLGLEDWSTPALRDKYEGQRVRVTGWLFFDIAHVYEADNTDALDLRGHDNWRDTAWEIHPVTSIELID